MAKKSTGSLIVNVTCVIASSLFTTFGLFAQKIAQRRNLACKGSCEESKAIIDPKAFRRWTLLIWFSGFLCVTIVSFILDLYSFATLGQSLVVPLGASLSVVENQLFAPCVLGEHFDKCRDISSSAMVILGTLFTTLFGPGGPFSGTEEDPTPDLDYSEMKGYFANLFSAPLFITFELFVVALLVACLLLYRSEWCHNLHFMMLGYAAGCFGGQQNLFLKGLGTSLATCFRGDLSVFADWLMYIFGICVALLAVIQLYFLNVGLASFDALLFVPTYTILYITSGTLVGMVFYQEYKFMSGAGWVFFSIGFVFISAAMTILATKSHRPTKEAVTGRRGCNVSVIGNQLAEGLQPLPRPQPRGGPEDDPAPSQRPGVFHRVVPA